jgi:replication factor A1
LKTGDVVKIAGGYVKAWKGVPQLTFDMKATLEKLGAETISKKDIKTQRYPLHELVEKKGALDVEVEGTVIEIREGSGVVYRCPQCRRVLQDSSCSVHGQVKGELDLRVKMIVDDGTGVVTSTLGREATEELLGRTLEEWKTMMDQKDGSTVMMQELYNRLFGHRLSLQGNALGDQFGTTLIVKKVRFADFDISKESERLQHELEES